MGVQVQWDNNEKTVLRYDYQGHWTWADLYAAVEQANTLIDSVPYTVAVIIDMTGSAGIPPGAIAHGRTLQQRAHARVLMQVTVNAGGFVVSLVKTFMKLYGTLVKTSGTYFAGSIAEARTLIAQKMPQPN